MAVVDAEIATYFQRYVGPLAATFIGLRILLFFLGKIYPYFYAFSMRLIGKHHHKSIKRQKEKLFCDLGLGLREENKPLAALEIGCGPGQNFAIYPPNTSLTLVEPNTKFQSLIAENAAKHPGVEVTRILETGAENLRELVEDGSQDVVVCSLMLCSVQNPQAVVTEARRVLKPGGRFYFMEHTRAHTRNSWIYWLQYIFAPSLFFLFHCDARQMPWVIIDKAGFSEVHFTKTDVDFKSLFFLWKVIQPHVFGYAVK